MTDKQPQEVYVPTDENSDYVLCKYAHGFNNKWTLKSLNPAAAILLTQEEYDALINRIAELENREPETRRILKLF